MTFRWPLLLWLLLLIPIAVAAYMMSVRNRAAHATRFSNPALLPNLIPATPGLRRHVAAFLYLLALASLIVAVARPQVSMAVPRERSAVVLVMDSSKSMESTDVQPSRLQAARTAARELIDRLPDPFLVGVVGFARTAQTLNRPTIDRVAARRALARLTTEWGTALGEGIEEALKTRVVSPQTAASHPPPPTVIVLLSDGNNTTGETTPDRAARDARAAEVRVYTIALGERQEVPGAGIVGHPVRPPDYDMLSGIADHTGGRFFSAPTSEALKTIYSRLGSRIGTVREPKEITVYFVGAAFLLLLVGGALSSLWFKRLP